MSPTPAAKTNRKQMNFFTTVIILPLDLTFKYSYMYHIKLTNEQHKQNFSR